MRGFAEKYNTAEWTRDNNKYVEKIRIKCVFVRRLPNSVLSMETHNDGIRHNRLYKSVHKFSNGEILSGKLLSVSRRKRILLLYRPQKLFCYVRLWSYSFQRPVEAIYSVLIYTVQRENTPDLGIDGKPNNR